MCDGESTLYESTVPRQHPISVWLEVSRTSIGRHALLLCTEADGRRTGVFSELQAVVRGHYLAPETMARRVASLGAPRAAVLLREHFPRSKIGRSADVGEILATEVVEQYLEYLVPIRRLRWKDGREMALRGDDVIGINGTSGRLRLLKGEAKSRAALTASVVAEAGSALDRGRGRPTRHTALFVAERLREQDQDELAEALESAVLNGFQSVPIEHMVFVLAGNKVESLLRAHLESVATRGTVRYAIGLRVRDHGRFITSLYREL